MYGSNRGDYDTKIQSPRNVYQQSLSNNVAQYEFVGAWGWAFWTGASFLIKNFTYKISEIDIRNELSHWVFVKTNEEKNYLFRPDITERSSNHSS